MNLAYEVLRVHAHVFELVHAAPCVYECIYGAYRL